MMKHFMMLIVITVVAFGCADAEFKGYNGTTRGNGANAGDGNNDNEFGNNGGNGNGFGNGTGGSGDSPQQSGFGFSFGSFARSFHIGDNNHDASGCNFRNKINTFDGEEYNFNFDIIEDNTSFQVVIHHCGVDFPGTNKAWLVGVGNPETFYAEMPLVISDNKIFMKKQDFGQVFTLNRGKYKIRVRTSQNGGTDKDDFVVGKVRFYGVTKPIKKGKATGA